MDFEDQLRDALRRKAAPAGFAERVLAAAGTGSPRARRLPARWLALAAALLLFAGIGWQFEQERQRRIAAEETARQLRVALRITVDRLVKAERKASARKVWIPVNTGERWQ